MVLFKIAPYLFSKKKMARYLTIFIDNHGEEFDVHGFKIMTDKEQLRFEEIATSITWPFAYYANSESLNYSNGEDFLSRIEFKEISKAEYDSFEKSLGGEFGTFITEEYLVSVLNGEDEEVDEYNDEYDDD